MKPIKLNSNHPENARQPLENIAQVFAKYELAVSFGIMVC
jgi:hypothetical protein